MDTTDFGTTRLSGNDVVISRDSLRSSSRFVGGKLDLLATFSPIIDGLSSRVNTPEPFRVLTRREGDKRSNRELC